LDRRRLLAGGDGKPRDRQRDGKFARSLQRPRPIASELEMIDPRSTSGLD